MEIWKDIKGFESFYEVSSIGNVRKISKKRNLKGDESNGYFRVVLSLNNIPNRQYIHRLVSLHFIPNPKNKPQVNHINGIKTDNRVENLEWCNGRENTSHSYLGRNKTSKYIGVHFRSDSNKWRASVRVSGKLVDLGTFKNESDAGGAYKKYIEENGIQNKYC